MKILAIQFRYLGDAVLMTPALRAIKEHFPDCALHVLVAGEAAPLFQHLPWLTRVWAFPRTRGKARIRQSWPVVRSLRRERFDRSVDFGGNDRGALVSWLCAARERLGVVVPGGFLGRRFCYTQRVAPAPTEQHETLRLIHILSGWNIAPPALREIEIRADPALAAFAEQLLPAGTILCHIASSQSKKEWPVRHWATLYRLATAAGHRLVFNTGNGPREQEVLLELKRLVPEAQCLPPALDRAAFLAVIRRARAFLANDTGPLHYAAGLGVPTIGLFGPTSSRRWAPLGSRHQAIQGPPCHCPGSAQTCSSASHCLAGISPDDVFQRLQKLDAKSSE